jgi:hypothetical protein
MEMKANKDEEMVGTDIIPPWTATISDEHWRVYREAIGAVQKAGAQFVLGGAFALAGYTGRCRDTKDLDFFVLPSEKDKVVDALTKCGFDDYHPTVAYDRGWIYRATRDDVIVDTIWRTPNRRSEMDEQWITRSRKINFRGEKVGIAPAEELLVVKLYVLQRDRCDWPDLINLLYATAGELDWDHVLTRLGADRPLLAGLLHVFNWVAPTKAAAIPDSVRDLFHLPKPTSEALERPEERNVELLDSRPWFAAFQPREKLMQL